MWDIAFPGTVMLLKLIFKLTVEQQLKPVDVAKAVLAFPIDIAFLSFSFGAAILYSKPAAAMGPRTLRDMFVVLLIAIIILIITTVLAKKSDAALTVNKFAWMFFHVVVAYLISFASVWGALNIGAL